MPAVPAVAARVSRYNNQLLNFPVGLDVKSRPAKGPAKYTAPKKLDTYWGHFYVQEQKA